MYIIFDTETTGLPRNWNAPITDTDNWPRAVQIAWQLHDDMGNLIEQKDYLIKPEGYDIPYDAERIHGISTALADELGADLEMVLNEFNIALEKAKFVVGQNVGFDVNILGCEFVRKGLDSPRRSRLPASELATNGRSRSRSSNAARRSLSDLARRSGQTHTSEGRDTSSRC